MDREWINCFARNVKEQHTLGSAAAQRSFTPQPAVASSLLIFCYLAVAIPAVWWTAAQVSSGPGWVDCSDVHEKSVLHVGPF